MSDLDLLADLVRIGESAAELGEMVKRRDDLAKEHTSIGDELTALEAEIEVRWGLLPHRTAIKITPSASAPLSDADLSTAVDRAAEAKIARGWEPPSDASPVVDFVRFKCIKCGFIDIHCVDGVCLKCFFAKSSPVETVEISVPLDPTFTATDPTDSTDVELTAMGGVVVHDDENGTLIDMTVPSIMSGIRAKQSRRDLPIPGPKPEPGPPMDLFFVRSGMGSGRKPLFSIRCHGLKRAGEWTKENEPPGQIWVAFPDQGETARLGLPIRATIEPLQPVAIGELRLAK